MNFMVMLQMKQMGENENTPDEYAFSMFGYNNLNDVEDDSDETGIMMNCLLKFIQDVYSVLAIIYLNPKLTDITTTSDCLLFLGSNSCSVNAVGHG